MEYNQHVHPSTLDLIIRHKPFQATPRLSSNRIWEIGHGHSRTVCAGMEIKPAQARVLLEEDVRLVERTITRLVTVPLYGRQFDALVSYVMDTGAFPFAESRMLRLLNRGWYDQVAVNILKHNMAKGLLNPYHARRLDEARLWNMECETRIAA